MDREPARKPGVREPRRGRHPALAKLGRPVGSPEEAAADYDSEEDSVNAELLLEGRYKRADKTYRELEGTSGYPGIRCAMFHRC